MEYCYEPEMEEFQNCITCTIKIEEKCVPLKGSLR